MKICKKGKDLKFEDPKGGAAGDARPRTRGFRKGTKGIEEETRELTKRKEIKRLRIGLEGNRTSHG